MDGADGVYPASEDTYLLIDALNEDAEFLRERFSSGLCLEVGCGSGEVSQVLTEILETSICISTDVNPLAVLKTHALLNRGSWSTDLILCDMFTAFQPNVAFEIIVFNPPYVPTDEDELHRALHSRDISASWAGGREGREVMDIFLEEFIRFLVKGGVMYMVLLEANKPNEVIARAKQRGFSVRIVAERKAGNEHLYILRFQQD